jgi:hypothetical protein
MDDIVSCRISRYWPAYMETGSHEDRMTVVRYLDDLKHVRVAGNRVLEEIMSRMPYVVYDDDRTYPRFDIDGRWYYVCIVSNTKVPNNVVLLFQQSVTTPGKDGRCRRLGTRKVELTFRNAYQTR